MPVFSWLEKNRAEVWPTNIYFFLGYQMNAGINARGVIAGASA